MGVPPVIIQAIRTSYWNNYGEDWGFATKKPPYTIQFLVDVQCQDRPNMISGHVIFFQAQLESLRDTVTAVRFGRCSKRWKVGLSRYKLVYKVISTHKPWLTTSNYKPTLDLGAQIQSTMIPWSLISYVNISYCFVIQSDRIKNRT